MQTTLSIAEMTLPEKAAEALNQTELNMKNFRKSMMALLFEYQDLETCFELNQQCFNQNLQVQEPVPQNSIELESLRKSIEQKENEFNLFQQNQINEMETREQKLGVVLKEIELREKKVEEKEKKFNLFQENQIREMEIRKEKMAIVLKEIDMREKKIEEQEKSVKLEKKQVEDDRIFISEKERHIKQCFDYIQTRVEEIQEQARKLEAREKNLETKEKELELKEKNLKTIKKGLALKENKIASRDNQVGSSNQSMPVMPHIHESETRFHNPQISNGRLKSRAWMHFTKIVKQDGKADKAICNYCQKQFSVISGSTGNLLRHIFDGKCPIYQTYQNHKELGQTCSQLSIGVREEEPSARQSDIGEEETRTPVVQYQTPIVLQPNSQTQLCTDPQMSSPKTSAIRDTTLHSDLSYQPHQLEYPQKDQSGILLSEQSLGTGIPDTLLLTNCSGSQATEDNGTGMGSSDYNCQEFQDRPCRNFDGVETETDYTSEGLRIQGRKRTRENESDIHLFHEDIEDLSTPVKTEAA